MVFPKQTFIAFKLIAGMAATLDTIAEQTGVEAARAESLHQAILSLDLLMMMCLISQILLFFLFFIFG